MNIFNIVVWSFRCKWNYLWSVSKLDTKFTLWLDIVVLLDSSSLESLGFLLWGNLRKSTGSFCHGKKFIMTCNGELLLLMKQKKTELEFHFKIMPTNFNTYVSMTKYIGNFLKIQPLKVLQYSAWKTMMLKITSLIKKRIPTFSLAEISRRPFKFNRRMTFQLNY